MTILAWLEKTMEINEYVIQECQNVRTRLTGDLVRELGDNLSAVLQAEILDIHTGRSIPAWDLLMFSKIKEWSLRN